LRSSGQARSEAAAPQSVLKFLRVGRSLAMLTVPTIIERIEHTQQLAIAHVTCGLLIG
jgi:hypothetical protein